MNESHPIEKQAAGVRHVAARLLIGGVVVWSITVILSVRVLGDRWWLGTLALFSPRWLLLFPLLLGLLAIPWVGRIGRIAFLLALFAAIFLASGFCLPLRLFDPKPDMVYRIVTCNVAGTRVDASKLLTLILDERVDVAVLQEYHEAIDLPLPAGWTSRHKGGLLIASRYPIGELAEVQRQLPGRYSRPVGIAATIDTPLRPLRIATLHLLSPRDGLGQIVDADTVIDLSKRDVLAEQTELRGRESRRVAEFMRMQPESVVVAGDFNMPVESYFFRTHWHPFRDAFESAGWGIGNTCFQTQGGITFGARIDHVLTRGNWRALRCRTAVDVGSDHLPVIADVYWQP